MAVSKLNSLMPIDQNTHISDGAGVRLDTTDELTQDFDKLKTGNSNKKEEDEEQQDCQDYTPRAIYQPRPDYNGTLLPDRYIVTENQEKTGTWFVRLRSSKFV